MKQNLQTKLDRYTKSISQQSIDPSKIKKLGLTSAAAMAAMVTVPVELNSQVVCGNQGTPTRTTLQCVDDLAEFNYTSFCAQFDFDGDGTDELQVRYYNYNGIYPWASMYVDPLTTQFWTVELSTYFNYANFPEYPTLRTDTVFQEVGDKLHIFPLSGGTGYGFIAFDGNAHPHNNGATPHPTTGQTIFSYNSALPYMWGANSEMDLNEVVVNAVSDMVNCVFPLPVELSKFEARATSNSILLEWSTESEINNAGFEIERSVDGVNYREISFVEGNENSQRTNHYTYEDKTAIKGQEYYYRLKQIDFDGKTEYSDVKFATIASNEFEFSMAPNPAQDIVTVDLIGYQDEKVMIEIYSISGELISSESRVVGEDKSMSLDITNLSGAMYFVKITDSKVSKYKKLMVSK